MIFFGERGKVNKDDLKLLSKLKELYKYVDKYYLANIYNIDETGIFYKMQPKYGLVKLTKNPKSIRAAVLNLFLIFYPLWKVITKFSPKNADFQIYFRN